MGTRSRIALEHIDGMIHSIYCHWDGYILGNGQVLQRHYKTSEKMLELIELGWLSSLGEEIGEAHDFDWRSAAYDEAMAKGITGRERHDYAETKPEARMCLAYCRDRGEDYQCEMHLSRQELVDYFNDSDQEYLYLFTRNGYWLVYSRDKKEWRPLLVELLAAEAKEAA